VQSLLWSRRIIDETCRTGEGRGHGNGIARRLCQCRNMFCGMVMYARFIDVYYWQSPYFGYCVVDKLQNQVLFITLLHSRPVLLQKSHSRFLQLHKFCILKRLFIRQKNFFIQPNLIQPNSSTNTRYPS
jgi:hypothetical protein